MRSTDGVDPATASIDVVSPAERVKLLIDAHARAVAAVSDASKTIVVAVDAIVRALRGGGRVIVLGAGTSGRLAVLDASELYPTFRFPPERWIGRIAGGDRALREAIEGAEDDAAAGALAASDATASDVVIGVSASGTAPFVCEALAQARRNGSTTIAIVNAPDAPLRAHADITILAETGPEPIAGSTRMRAGTAQKIVLNTLSTAAMIELGATYGNRMVDVVATNAKLRDRALRLVQELTNREDAAGLLESANGNVKLAILMGRSKLSLHEAEVVLAAQNGRLRSG